MDVTDLQITSETRSASIHVQKEISRLICMQFPTHMRLFAFQMLSCIALRLISYSRIWLNICAKRSSIYYV